MRGSPRILLSELYRLAATSAFCVLLHHFVVCQFFAPLFLGVVQRPAVQHFLQTNAAVLWMSTAPWIRGRLDMSGRSDVLLFFFASFVPQYVLYVFFNAFFAACDKYRLLEQYRVHVPASQEPPRSLIVRCLRDKLVGALLTPLIVTPVYLFFFRFSPGKAPSASLSNFTNWDASLCQQWLVFATAFAVFEAIFYVVHRALHAHPTLYQLFHKHPHHDWHATKAMASEDSHPLELFFAGIVSMFTAWYFLTLHCGVPLAAFISYWVCRIIETNTAHAMYDDGGTLLSALGVCHGGLGAFHGTHHCSNRGNLGTPWLDYVGDTIDPIWFDAKKRPEGPFQREVGLRNYLNNKQ